MILVKYFPSFENNQTMRMSDFQENKSISEIKIE